MRDKDNKLTAYCETGDRSSSLPVGEDGIREVARAWHTRAGINIQKMVSFCHDYVPYILSYFDSIPHIPDLPTSGPQIYGLNPSYRLGETLNLTCESGAGKVLLQ